VSISSVSAQAKGVHITARSTAARSTASWDRVRVVLLGRQRAVRSDQRLADLSLSAAGPDKIKVTANLGGVATLEQVRQG